MSQLLERFADLNEVLLADFKGLGSTLELRPRRLQQRDILIHRLLKPLLPESVRAVSGNIVDARDVAVGPIDVIGCSDQYPIFGEEAAALVLADSAIFNFLLESDENDRPKVGQLAKQVKNLGRQAIQPICFGCVDFGISTFEGTLEWMKSPEAQAVDAYFSLGQYVIVRNQHGWYGDVVQLPFVTERGGAQALKAFAFLLVQLSHGYFGIASHLADYQHL